MLVCFVMVTLSKDAEATELEEQGQATFASMKWVLQATTDMIDMPRITPIKTAPVFVDRRFGVMHHQKLTIQAQRTTQNLSPTNYYYDHDVY